ncbi:hypothetical protein AB0I53_28915 [Saccharopolyspora sp. NPDC050389]|uniref:hypothetical protein n=1 Tax=Saccharopolyspora sp. NPDC050389 TaxID=3155516 RepID=UPI0033FCD7AB
MAWGRMELPAAESADGEPGPYRDAVVGKLARIRRAQQDGLLDAAWDPIDIMALVSQIALTWSDQAELAALAPRTAACGNARRNCWTERTVQPRARRGGGWSHSGQSRRKGLIVLNDLFQRGRRRRR